MASATIIDGKAKAAEITASITKSTAELLDSTGIRPGLAAVMVGEDPASAVYVRNKKRTAEACGFHSVRHALASDSTQEAVLQLVQELNADPAIHGILVQLPLPDHLDDQIARTQGEHWKRGTLEQLAHRFSPLDWVLDKAQTWPRLDPGQGDRRPPGGLDPCPRS